MAQDVKIHLITQDDENLGKLRLKLRWCHIPRWGNNNNQFLSFKEREKERRRETFKTGIEFERLTEGGRRKKRKEEACWERRVGRCVIQMRSKWERREEEQRRPEAIGRRWAIRPSMRNLPFIQEEEELCLEDDKNRMESITRNQDLGLPHGWKATGCRILTTACV